MDIIKSAIKVITLPIAIVLLLFFAIFLQLDK